MYIKDPRKKAHCRGFSETKTWLLLYFGKGILYNY